MPLSIPPSPYRGPLKHEDKLLFGGQRSGLPWGMEAGAPYWGSRILPAADPFAMLGRFGNKLEKLPSFVVKESGEFG